MTVSQSRLESVAWTAARIFIVIGLIPNGIRKIITFDSVAAMMGGAPPQMIDGQLFPAQEPLFAFPVPAFFLASAILMDLLGALLIILGYRTRAAATVLFIYCIFAMLVYHTNVSGPQDVVAILRNLPLVGGLLIMSAVGAGPWSMDNKISK